MIVILLSICHLAEPERCEVREIRQPGMCAMAVPQIQAVAALNGWSIRRIQCGRGEWT